MAVNITPIFSKVGAIGFSDRSSNNIINANVTRDLSSGNTYLVFTADGTNGSYVEKLIVQPLGNNVATVMRVFLNNGNATSNAQNNAYIKDQALAATSNTDSTSIGNTEIPLGFALPPGYKIYVTIGTAVAMGFSVVAIAGNY